MQVVVEVQVEVLIEITPEVKNEKTMREEKKTRGEDDRLYSVVSGQYYLDVDEEELPYSLPTYRVLN